MRLIWIFILFELANISNAFDEYLTIWAPRKFYDLKDYNVVVLPSNIDRRTEILLKFRKNYGTLALGNKLQNITVPNPRHSGTKKEFDLIMTLHQNKTISSHYHQMCMTQTLQTIEVEKREFYSFIQTDKPIYKPGDEVKFRVVVLDRDLEPFHMNNIDIQVFDPLGQMQFQFDDLDKIIENFLLPSNSSIGSWKISIVVDKKQEYQTFKKFDVQKIIPPQFTAHINANDKRFLIDSILLLSFYANYTSGGFVHGNAKITIKCISNDQIVAEKSFLDICDVQNILFSIRDDLKATTTTKLDYEAELVFTEPKSGVYDTKVLKFSVQSSSNLKIQANHPEKFIPGLPFGIKIFIYDWRDSIIKSSNERVEINIEFRLDNTTELKTTKYAKIGNGVAKYIFEAPEYVDELIIRVQYLEAKYEKTIGRGAVVVEINKLTVDYEPKNLKFGDKVEIQIRADSEINQLVGIVTSRNGIVYNQQINCHYEFTCEFTVEITKDMIPAVYVEVYYLKNKKTIIKGDTVIKIDDLGLNMLDMEAESTQIKIKEEDIIKELGDFDGSNRITVFTIRESSWNHCTLDELKNIEKGRRFL